MPRLNVGRTVHAEADLSKRIAYEREARGQSHEALADLMTKAGCAIAGSSVYKIEKGTPRRRISVDEMCTLAKIWGLSLEDLLTPVAFIKQRRAKAIAQQLPGAFDAFEDAVISGLRLYKEYGELATNDPELLEYINNHAAAVWGRDDLPQRTGVDLGDNISEQDVADLRRELVTFWGRILRLAHKAATGRDS